MTRHADPAEGFVPPPYPYDELDGLIKVAAALDGGAVDMSIGTPMDDPPSAVIDALASSGSERGYPPSIGSAALREAAAGWLRRRVGVEVAPAAIGACIGTKEFVGTLPQWLQLRTPRRDTILYPEIAYPTYAMGAELAGCRAVPVRFTESGTIDLESIDESDADRALALWINSPGNPTGAMETRESLAAIATWGRERSVPVFSDECYIEFAWGDERPSILDTGSLGVVAVHSLSKRSNLAGVRVGFYAGDPELVEYLQEVRKHVGMMVPGPAQAAAVAALADDAHVDAQRDRYRRRLERMAGLLDEWSEGRLDVQLPAGGFYLWVDARPLFDSGGFLAMALADDLGVVASLGRFYGDVSDEFVRIAVVQPDDRLDLVAARIARSTGE